MGRVSVTGSAGCTVRGSSGRVTAVTPQARSAMERAHTSNSVGTNG